MLNELAGDIAINALNALKRSGQIGVGTSTMRWKHGTLAIHSDFGPIGQDKEMNQDFVIAWTPDDVESSVEWAVVMADGVTSSFQSEVGARIACSVGLAALLDGTGQPLERARHAVDAAGRAIGDVADEMLTDSDRFRPETEFDATWRYMLREGLFLQTTLTVAWSERSVLHIAMIGDGGIVTDGFGSATTPVTGLADDTTNRVHALGPNNQIVSDLDYLDSVALEGAGVVALFTDGIGRGIANRPVELFEIQRTESVRSQESSAQFAVQELISRRSQDFEDNLTLAFVTYDEPDDSVSEVPSCQSPH